jgi:23S rRNA pseudouridine1911/1915/1917 synthase
MTGPTDRVEEPDEPTDGDDDGDDLPVPPGAAHHGFTVEPERAGERIDALIAAIVPALSRAQVQRLIDGAQVRLNGAAVAKPGQRVRTGDAVEVDVPPAEPIELAAEDLPLAVLYQDADLIAVDKPAGLVVHPAAGHARGTLVNALLFHCRDLSGIGGALRPGIVPRLDKDTSGVMIARAGYRAHPGGIVAESTIANGSTGYPACAPRHRCAYRRSLESGPGSSLAWSGCGRN